MSEVKAGLPSFQDEEKTRFYFVNGHLHFKDETDSSHYGNLVAANYELADFACALIEEAEKIKLPETPIPVNDWIILSRLKDIQQALQAREANDD